MRNLLDKLLGLQPGEVLVEPEFFFRRGWVLALLLAIGAVAFAVWLYRSENVPSRVRRAWMTAFHALALTLLCAMLMGPAVAYKLIKPIRQTVLVLLDTSESMSLTDKRDDPRDVDEAAAAIGKGTRTETGGPVRTQALAQAVSSLSRLKLAQAALANPSINLLPRLGADCEVRFFCFDDTLKPCAGEGSDMAWLRGQAATGKVSRIGSAVDEAVARYAGQPIAGVVVLSDFAWNQGEDPLVVAGQLRERGIPVYTVGIGLPAPPDINVRRIVAPDVVFAGDKVPLRVQLDSVGYDQKTCDLTLLVSGKPVQNRTVTLTGGTQFEELILTPGEAGSATLEMQIAPLPNEASTANNSATHKVRIIDEKIKVLYVEGMPRWEYRYLRWVLLRDPRLEVKFLMTQGDANLAAISPYHIAKYPEDAAAAMKNDLVILGDVPATYFTAAQLDRIEELVKTRGGSLLMLAGPIGAPMTYLNTPIGKMLPVSIGAGGWMPVSDTVHPVVTPEGEQSRIVSLALPRERNDRLWETLKPLGFLPELTGAKAGATVLLSISSAADRSKPYPLVAWHRYGNGKTMFVGTEDLWRLRREVGDLYHAQFWGQAIQFLTLSRLLGENKRITIETDRASYAAGEHVQVFANVLSDAYEPVRLPLYTVRVEKKGEKGDSVELALTPVPGVGGLYTGLFVPDADGGYMVRTAQDEQAAANSVEFEILAIPLEQRETAMQQQACARMAELSGGKAYTFRTLSALPDGIVKKEQTRIIRTERNLWDLPALFVLLVLVCGVEWFMRRRDNLV
jgi:hypothetical protein